MFRKIDYVGRIVIPAEICRNLHIDPEDELKVEVIDGKIVLSPVKAYCKLCEKNTIPAASFLPICQECLERIEKVFEQTR